MKPLDLSKFRTQLTKSINGISMGFNDPKTWVSTGCYALNYLISSDFNKGVPLGKSTVLAGESGCLPESAKVTIRHIGEDNTPKKATVGDLRELFHSGHSVEIDTPDGFQKIVNWFDKGELATVAIRTDGKKVTRCAVNHMLQVEQGGFVPEHGNTEHKWQFAKDLHIGDKVLTADGWEVIQDINFTKTEACYDFEVDHPNHRYYGDGFVSHNSGKSFLASGNLVREAQKQGIFVVLIDTENALDESWLHALEVDTSPEKMLRISCAMIDDVAKIISDFMKDYKANYSSEKPEDRPKVMFVIDSLGMLMTPTDVAQFEAGEMKGDMGRKPKALKALVTNVTNMFGEYDVGLVCTNHSYASQDMFDPDPKMSGGCLVAGSKLFMEDGTLKAIEDVVVGDRVLTRFGSEEVTRLWQYEKPTFTLELSDGSTLECSPEHKFLVQNSDGSQEWVAAEGLMVTQQIVKIAE